jgi:hypothetical protein
METKRTVMILFFMVVFVCLPLGASAQARSAPYDFFSGCNDSKQWGEAVSIVRTDPFTGKVYVDVRTPWFGRAYGRAGAGINYIPNFTGTAKVEALIRINPPSMDAITLISFDYLNIPITPGFVNVRSHAYVNARGGGTVDVENTNQFRGMELTVLNAIGLTSIKDFLKNLLQIPIDYEQHVYNPAKEVSVSVIKSVIQGRPVQICGGIQSNAGASSLFPFNTVAKGFYEAEVLKISVTPLTSSPTPTPAPTPKPNPTPAPTPVPVKPSIFVIKKNDTGVGTTEAHVLSGPDMFRRFALNIGTAQHATGDEYVFRVADWDRDGQPDIFAIKKRGTGTGSTEVHILSGAGSYQRFLVNTGTPQHETWYEYDFQVADWNRDGYQDLIIIKKYNTGTNSTEVHILSGASKFQDFILHTGTPQEETGDNYDFDMGDWDRDGYPDLFIIKKNGTGTGMVEVHILSGASSFQRFILNTGTAQPLAGDEYVFRIADWDGDGKDDLFGIKKYQTGTKSTEIHILSGASNFRQFLLQTGTSQEETGSNYDFDVARVKTFDSPAQIGNPIGQEAQPPSFNAAANVVAPPVNISQASALTLEKNQVTASAVYASQEFPVSVAIVNAGGALPSAIADVEIIDSGGRKVWQQFVENQTFAVGETKFYAFTWTPQAPGTYQFKVGVFGANWSPLLYWNDQAGTVIVNGETTPTPTPTPTPSPSPSPTPAPNTYAIGGRVTDIDGNAVSGVDVVYGAAGMRPNDAVTDSNGHYVISEAKSGLTYNVTPLKQGYYFIPRSQSFENISGDRTANFTARPSPSRAPVILTEENSDRAVSLNATTLMRGPFLISTPFNFGADDRTRIMIFVANIELPAGETLSDGDVSILAKDAQNSLYLTKVEYVGKVSGFNWLTQIVLKLPDDTNLTGDFWLRVNFLGSLSKWTYVTMALRPLQYLTFLEGDPGRFADGIVIDGTGGFSNSAFELSSPLRLGGVQDGLTFSVLVPSNVPQVHSLSFNIVSEKGGPCYVSFGAGGGFTSGVSGYNFRYVNIPQKQLESFVTSANALSPGCNFTLHDTYVKGLYLYPDNVGGPNIILLDGAVVGLGQNQLPLVSRP